MESYRKIDMNAENALAKFMDESLYSKMQDKHGRIKYQRVNDYQKQMEGIDVIIESEGEIFYIDEKASLYYSNMMIPTFAFEIDSIQRKADVPVEGWLVKDQLKTNYYMLIWPNIRCQMNQQTRVCERVSLSEIKMSDFTIVEAMLIKKQRILDYLESYDWTKRRMLAYAREMRKECDTSERPKREDINKDCYFYYTSDRAEKPINIVIKKGVLRLMAEANYFISKENYASIKKT